jgi:hypothetical protein
LPSEKAEHGGKGRSAEISSVQFLAPRPE